MRNLVVLLTLSTLALGCGGNGDKPNSKPAAQGTALTPKARKDVGEPIATVGDAVIGVEQFKHEASRKQPADGTALSPAERREVLDEIVTEEVLFQEALKRGLYQDNKVRKILVNLLLREDVYATVKNEDFEESVLTKYYEEHLNEFIVPEKVQVKRIFIRVTPERDDAASKALADKLYASLQKDPSQFAVLATENSDGPYKRRGGDIGFMPRDGKPGIDDEVVKAAFEMKVDEIGAPFKTADGYHILYVVNRRERVERSFDQMRGSVLRMVKQDRYKELTESYIDKAKKGYEVKLQDAKIDSVDLSRSGRMAAPTIPPGVKAPGGEAPH